MYGYGSWLLFLVVWCVLSFCLWEQRRKSVKVGWCGCRGVLGGGQQCCSGYMDKCSVMPYDGCMEWRSRKEDMIVREKRKSL